jgi:hypothetical protein
MRQWTGGNEKFIQMFGVRNSASTLETYLEVTGRKTKNHNTAPQSSRYMKKNSQTVIHI